MNTQQKPLQHFKALSGTPTPSSSLPPLPESILFKCEYLIMMTAQTELLFTVICAAFHVEAANPPAFLFNFFVS